MLPKNNYVSLEIAANKMQTAPSAVRRLKQFFLSIVINEPYVCEKSVYIFIYLL